ncbi:hypothetical protein ACQ86N_10975 [Puia sp. P3]|uniref:hypothetical protein n=1 Tax=Puia sp. P3 TaxID=3423952 RepID=UPI003D674E6C
MRKVPVTNLYNAYVGLDCSMLEINPLFKTSDEKIIAVDCKMNLDDNSLMRHPELEALRDISEEDPTEVEAGKYNLNFRKTGRQRRLYGQWRRSGHGYDGHDQAQRR